MKARIGMVLLALLAALGGCATTRGLVSSEGASLSDPQQHALATDAVAHLAAAYPPAKTRLRLAQAGAFGSALERALRAKGYAVALAQPEGAAQPVLRYAVEPYGEQVLLVVQVVEAGRGAYQLNRLYRLADDAVSPASGATVMLGEVSRP